MPVGFTGVKGDTLEAQVSRVGITEPVSAVVPALNEGAHIGPVLEAMSQTRALARFVVVDDGSTDGTAEVVSAWAAHEPRLHLLRLTGNRGKGGAMVAGAEAAGTDLIVFLDADLVHLSPRHIEDLIDPVRAGQCLMTLGLFTSGRRQTDLSHRLTPYLSGQRCLRWSFFRSTPELATARAGVEVALSLHARRNGYKVLPVRWRGVTHVMKSEKLGRPRGWWLHLLMFGEIGRYLIRQWRAPRPSVSTGKAGWARDGTGE
jgi:glycosyltransferase involved in cell wall biosynthesis